MPETRVATTGPEIASRTMPETAARTAAEKLSLTQEAVLGEMMRLAFANIRDCIHVEDDGKVRLDLTRLTRDHAAGIVELTAKALPARNKEGDVSAAIVDVKVKLADKRPILLALGRHVGLFNGPTPEPPGTDRRRPEFSDPQARLQLARELLFFIADARELARRADEQAKPGNEEHPDGG